MEVSDMPTMPVGTEFFDKLVSGDYYFVDKTKYIKEFWENKSDVTLITRPRRFGKTLFMQMLKEFFSVENVGKKNLFEGLEISKDKEFCDKHQNKYPVIFVTLKEIKDKNFESARISFSQFVSDLFSNFKYLLASDCIDDTDKEWFSSICGGAKENIRWNTLSISLKKLSDMLYKHYGMKPIILIDEYDTPIQMAWQNGYYNDMIGFMKIFLGNILKTNSSLGFAVLTGVLRISKESIFSDLNNLDVLTVTSENLNKIMGFTEEEVLDLASQVNSEDKLPEIKKWYDGYNFGGAEIYNPFSVVKYFKENCRPGVYWINTSGNIILKEMLKNSSMERIDRLKGLMTGKRIRTYMDDKMVYSDIHKSDTALYTMLLTAGYLKGMCEEYTPNGLFYEMQIPNLEVYQAYKKEILSYVTDEYDYTSLMELLEAIKSGDAPVIQKYISTVLVNTASVYDLASSDENREQFYHGLMLGLTALMNHDYVMESNRESGYGRFDIALFPKQADSAGVIMEFKARNKLKRWADYNKFQMDKALEPTCKRALEQIDKLEYVTELQKRNVGKIIKIGVGFCGKYVAVRVK